jgi:hypothetical protein
MRKHFTKEKIMRKTTLAAFVFGSIILSAAAGCDTGTPATNNVVANRPAVVTNANTVVVNTAPATAAGNVRVADITSNWNNYAGKTVIVSGWV